MAKNENNFRTSLTKALKAQYGDAIYIQKNHGNQFSAGLVDLEVVLYGQTRFIELKATGDNDHAFNWKELTGLQHLTLRQIHKAGGVSGVLVYFKGQATAVWVPYLIADKHFHSRAKTPLWELTDTGCRVVTRTALLGGGGYFARMIGIEIPSE